MRLCRVRGEISNLSCPPSGHYYFSLKDEKSVINCVMFREDNQNLEFKIENGQKVIANGSISVYKPYGKYQIIVRELQPAGVGELYIKYKQLLEKLRKEGLFDGRYKKELPKYPEKIGVVTSPTGAAIHDIINTISRRYPVAEIILVPTVVQGVEAAPSIVKSLRLLETLKDIDAVIVGRGGGSLEELWAFNEEIVARAIFDCTIPVVSAVGHEVDVSIADFVADVRAPTPTGAAEIVCPDKRELLQRVEACRKRIEKMIQRRVREEQQYLDDLLSRIIRGLQHVHGISKSKFEKISLSKGIRAYLDKRRMELNLVHGKLMTLNPEAVLERGYSVTMKGDELVDSISKVEELDRIRVTVKDGNIISDVRKREERR